MIPLPSQIQLQILEFKITDLNKFGFHKNICCYQKSVRNLVLKQLL